MYSILGKLEALRPQPETPKETAQKIYESVAAQGSVLEGVAKVESRLKEKFAESNFSQTSKAIQKSGKSKASADAIAATIGREKLGQKEMTRRSVAGRKDEGEITPTLTGTKHRSTNAYGGSPKEKDPLATLDKAGTNRIEKAIGVKFNHGQHNTIKVDEKYDPVKAVKQCAKDYMDMVGYTSVDQLEAEDIESIGGDCQMNYQDVCEILGCNLPDSLGPVKSYGPDEHGNIVDFEESTCNECGMYESECGCDHTMKEDEDTHLGGKKVKIDKGIIHKSKATVDTEKELSRGDVPDLDKDDVEPKAKQNRRGAPKKADSERSNATQPWGGKPPKDTYKHQKGSFVHKVSDKAPKGSPEYMGESKLSQRFAQLSEGRLMDDTGETMEHILNRFKHEVRNFEQGGDLDQDLYEALFDYYCDNGEMPYGVAKARTGDPMEWVATNLESHLRGGGIVDGNPDEDMFKDEGIEMEAGIPDNLPPEQIPGKEDLLKGKGRNYYEEDTMEHELNELAKLAGLTVADEGNAFSGAVAKAKADGIQPGEKITVGGKEYPVKESTTLGDIARLAGVATEGRDYGDTDVIPKKGEKVATYNNTPEEETFPEEVLTKGGDGEVAGKEKKMHPDKPTFKNSDNPLDENVDPLDNLSRKLLRAYESIKIQK